MCILLAALEQHPEYPLIVIHNREEAKDRGDQTLDPAVDADALLHAVTGPLPWLQHSSS